jgi:hypothetical protein
MVSTPLASTDLNRAVLEDLTDLSFQLPDPEDAEIAETEFQQQIDRAWQVCDRFDLQVEIWRGRILRTVRDREKWYGDGRGTGFLNWLKDRDISKTQAYKLIELANSADTLLDGCLEPEDVNQFSKGAFIETAKAQPEVQQMISEAVKQGDRMTRREVRHLADQWTAVSTDLLPEVVLEKVETEALPVRYLGPLVREMQKLPEIHQEPIREAIAENPDVDTLKQITTEARSLAKYLNSAPQVQALGDLDMELALEEALRIGCLSSTADLVNQAAQLEQLTVKLYLTWKRLGSLAERLYLDTGASTPHLRSLLTHLNGLSGEVIETGLTGSGDRTIRVQITSD